MGAAAFMLLVAAGDAEARVRRVMTMNTAARTAAVAKVNTAAKLGADCCAPAPCAAPCCVPCPPPVKQCITVCHPCTGCPVNVEVCLPACCEGAPTQCCRRTLFGAGAVDLTWCCGEHVIVRFSKCGDYRVVYR
jgi:hypothetical protein